MPWIEFKNYQEKAVADLREKANRLLEKEGGRILVFKARPDRVRRL